MFRNLKWPWRITFSMTTTPKGNSKLIQFSLWTSIMVFFHKEEGQLCNLYHFAFSLQKNKKPCAPYRNVAFSNSESCSPCQLTSSQGSQQGCGKSKKLVSIEMRNFFSAMKVWKASVINTTEPLTAFDNWWVASREFSFWLLIHVIPTIISHSSFLFIAMLKIGRLLKNCMRFVCLSFALKFSSLV